MRKPLRSAVKSRKAPVRAKRAAPKRAKAAPEAFVEEAAQLEQISLRYEQAELAWQRMTAPPEGDDAWVKVEEHLLTRDSGGDKDRRWKFYAK